MGNKLEKSNKGLISSDGAQYGLTLGVMAVLLYVVGIPFYVIFFLGAFSFFLFKIFTSGSRGESRRIFEFYLIAGEMLREDGRNWYGFELRETIDRGEKILKTMSAAPPLMHFVLGALYQKSGEFENAVRHLEYVFDPRGNRESTIVFPTPALREYVRILRKIERDPAEAPLMSASIRRLERLRKTRGAAMLVQCRGMLQDNGEIEELPMVSEAPASIVYFQDESFSDVESSADRGSGAAKREQDTTADRLLDSGKGDRSKEKAAGEQNFIAERKTISEVLQDIYDDKVQ